MRDIPALLADLNAYQSRVKLGGNHRYTFEGKHKPGVTTIIKTMDAPFLDEWKVRVQVEGTARAAYTNPPIENEPLDAYVSRLKALGAEEYEHERLSDEAAKVGKDVHALIEHSIRTMLGQSVETPAVCEEALFRFAGWKEWAKANDLRPLATEARVYHSTHDYCGTIDALVTLRGEPMVLDWKPTPTLYPERKLQSAAYRKALVSMGWPEMAGAIVCIPRDGGDIEARAAEAPGPDLDEAFSSFLHLLGVYWWLRKIDKEARAAYRERQARVVQATEKYMEAQS